MAPAINNLHLHNDSVSDSLEPDIRQFNEIDKNDFVMEVLYDGRYINELTRNPEKVAAELGISVDEKILNEIRQSNLPKLMGDACDQTAIAIARDEITAGFTRPPSMDIAIPATIAIVISTTIVSSPGELAGMTDVDDESPDAEDKL